MTKNTKIVLKSGKDQSLKRYHPWVFSGAIKKIYGEVNEGDLVEVFSNKDEFLGLGHYQIGSIAIRIISFQHVKIDQAFWNNAIQDAYNLRIQLDVITKETNAYRLIHAEGDNLPGLIIDMYDGTAVIQLHSVGMYRHLDEITSALQDTLKEGLKSIYLKSKKTLPFKADIEIEDKFLSGEEQVERTVLENGLKFKVNWQEGQKTGFFLDQRYNRWLVETFSQNKSVLNVFCYTGGFSVYAMKGGAHKVVSVDSSAKAIDLTDENVDLNFPDDHRHESFAVDAFDYLEKDLDFDVIILDPPAFAKHKNVLNNALQGYKRLNAKAISKIKSGGIIFTFSCSQVVSKEKFKQSVFAAAANTGRKVRILHYLSQPLDHPTNIYHPESEYLKGLVIQVTD